MQLILFKGLPASGKSTVAKQMTKKDLRSARINRDDIRLMQGAKGDIANQFTIDSLAKMLFPDRRLDRALRKIVEEAQGSLADLWSNQKRIREFKKSYMGIGFKGTKDLVAQTIIAKFFRDLGWNIIVDDTGFNPKDSRRLRELCKGYEIEIIDMHQPPYSVTLDQCLERNDNRDARVPRVAIFSMVKRWNVFGYHTPQQPYKSDNPIVVCDLDGTLFDIEHRLHFIDRSGNQKSQWSAFFDAMVDDVLRPEVKSILDDCYPDHDIVIVSGRPDSHKAITEQSLQSNGVRYNALYMRKNRDFRPDEEVKQDILDEFLPVNQIEMVIDDRKKVIDQWRSNGLNVTDVSIGDNDF